MRFGVLGPLEVLSATGEMITVGGPKQRALLVTLLLDAGRVVGMPRLVAGQYGDDPPTGAANAVQAQVSRLRRVLGADLIEFHGNGYRITAEPDDVDAHRFERLAKEGHRLLVAGHHAGAAATLREAMALWRGPALVDLSHDTAQAARLEDSRLAAREDLIEAELALPEGSPVAELRALVAAHPLRERLRGQLMRALYAAGRGAAALAEFDEARRLLADELGTDPSPELAATQLAILRAEQPAPPTRRKPAAQLTSFVGRERELALLDELRDTRLVTILGPGGTGKTRLAIESARRGRREACFVDLSPLDDGGQVPHAVLGALGVRDSGLSSATTDPTPRLVAALNQDLLLILDNCEHVVTAVALLTRTLLAECPRLTILATSREPLGLTGETLIPLAPLDIPPQEVPAAEAPSYPAVRLFADRAAAVRPGFLVDRDNTTAVVRICAALDGLPLAMELAAARLRQFTVEELARRLAEHDRFRLLSRGDRTAAARHRTLHAVVEWSWDLLSAEEQVLARRFAVFTGGAPLAAVEAVCGVEDAGERLADLMDKSIVDVDGGRYRMLDTIRLFCAQRLAESGEQEPMRRAHARYHLELAQRVDPHLRRAEQLDWLATLSAEHDNLMAALRWAAHEDRETAFRLIAALAAYWWLSGRRSQAGAAAAELLRGDAPGGLDEEYVSCVVHAVPTAAPEHWSRAAEIVGTLAAPLRHPFGVVVWGMAAGPPEDVSDTLHLLGSDPWLLSVGRLSMALLALLGGREMLDVLAVVRGFGERWAIAQALDGLAQVASWRGEWHRARQLWAEALELVNQLGALEEYADLLCHRADCLLRQGEAAGAIADYRRAADLSASAGRQEPFPVAELGLARVARLRGDVAEARDRLRRVLGTTTAGEFVAGAVRTHALTELGRLAEMTEDPVEALRQHRAALAEARNFPMIAELAHAVEGKAGAVLLTGSGERAALLLGVAVALRGMAVTGDRDVARIADGARDLVGSTAFAETYARGADMTRDQALTVVDSLTG